MKWKIKSVLTQLTTHKAIKIIVLMGIPISALCTLYFKWDLFGSQQTTNLAEIIGFQTGVFLLSPCRSR